MTTVQAARRAQKDKLKAISAARNPKESNFGDALLRTNVFQTKLLSCELGKIQQLGKRSCMHLDQQKKRFLQNHVLPEPSILVERPPSPGTFETDSYDSYLCDSHKSPHYMKPLKSRSKSASVIPTIDMFTVVKKKKANLWENAMLDKKLPNFQSCVLPSYPLSTEELQQLQRNYTNSKKLSGKKSAPLPKTAPVRRASPSNKTTSKQPSGVFLTQLLRDDEDGPRLAYDRTRPVRKTSVVSIKETRRTSVGSGRETPSQKINSTLHS